MNRWRARPSREGGQASVELALLLPVVVVLLLAILQVGLLARDVVLVGHASREAARAAAADPSPQAAAEAARQSSGLDADRLAVAVSGRGAPGSRVRVTVTYRSPTSIPLVGTLLGDRTIVATTTMRVETALRNDDKRDIADIWARDSSRTVVAWKDLWFGRRNGTESGSARSVRGCSPSRTYLLSLHHQPAQTGSGGTLWRIQQPCSSERSQPLPARRCSHC